METLKKCANALGEWVYTIFNVQVPYLNISFWTFALAIAIFGLFLRTLTRDKDGNVRTSSNYQNDNNNNKIYRER